MQQELSNLKSKSEIVQVVSVATVFCMVCFLWFKFKDVKSETNFLFNAIDIQLKYEFDSITKQFEALKKVPRV